MYNFKITSTLKTSLDHIVRRGVTFNDTVVDGKATKEGLLKDKKVYTAFSSAGIYSERPMQSCFGATLKAVFGWLGRTDMTAFRALRIRIVVEEIAFLKAADSIVIG